MNTKWVSIFGSAISITENKPENYGKNITLRYPIHLPFDGDKIKVTFDNFCGTEAVAITKATLLYKNEFYPLSFQGKPSCFLEQHGTMVSDELSVPLCKEATAYISFYLEDYTLMRSGVYMSGPLSHGLYAIGDCTETIDIPIEQSRKTNIFYFLQNVSIQTSGDKHAIVCFGDSITAQDWPDYLSLRCRQEGYSNTSIIRRAASGSRLLRQYDCITYESYGLSGHNRYKHEIPTEGADTLIIQQGINDIIHPVGEEINPFRPMSDLPSVSEMIEELKSYILYAKDLGYKVYVGTLLPIEGWRTYAPFRERMRQAYNEWIRSNSLADGCIDFDLATRDPINPHAFQKGYDSGDHLHPSSEGYKAMADAIPNEILF